MKHTPIARRAFALFSLAITSLLMTSLSALPATNAAKPNVIFILYDDQGFTGHGFMGHKVVQTPNLDRMASQSLLYTSGYALPVTFGGKLDSAADVNGRHEEGILELTVPLKRGCAMVQLIFKK